ncbi:hypothetical protein [Brevibacillus borstelensis]|uniref:hypothetical protein n=1 Tax=Brevibacillus borstelensis TaxID=45462 RepID=UPI001D0B27D5|nr:hypothetical protein [Brevibacillus borstelensis]MCC0567380.1 hypothetical protein [Brevibacillus borstelensis]
MNAEARRKFFAIAPAELENTPPMMIVTRAAARVYIPARPATVQEKNNHLLRQ